MPSLPFSRLGTGGATRSGRGSAREFLADVFGKNRSKSQSRSNTASSPSVDVVVEDEAVVPVDAFELLA